MSQRHRKPEVTRNDDFYYKKKSSYRKYIIAIMGQLQVIEVMSY
jgi:hypothetical protein